jgi:hypothetical protein
VKARASVRLFGRTFPQEHRLPRSIGTGSGFGRAPSHCGTMLLVKQTDPNQCERCGRVVEPGQLWNLNIELPADGRIERKICVVCAADVRRFVLVQPDSRDVTEVIIDERQRPPTTVRIGWLLVRAVAYVAIAAGVFALVSWLTSI